MTTQECTALPNEQYAIAWICAIQCELTAARMILDTLGKIHADHPRKQSEGDKNAYLLGEIQGHNVVVAALPSGQYGTNSATRVAEHLLRSFTNVRIGLMVGIAGGAPNSGNDIRLGDVVVGIPGNGHSGVLHYRFGKTIQGQEFQITAHHDKPPQLLLSAIAQLRGKLDLATDSAIDEYVRKALHGRRPKVVREFGRPESSTDRLYASDFVHQDQRRSCKDICDPHPTKIIDRTEWMTYRSEEPEVFYGLVASADELMKDASFRDQLSCNKEVLCFEMEAAGMANSFPCLIVRGICDYSDTHKNKSWQGYAALIAAAYAALLLGMIPAEKVGHEKELIYSLESLEKSNKVIHATVDTMHTYQKTYELDKWLKPLKPASLHHAAQSLRHSGSGEWLIRKPAFERWRNRSQSFLWLSGFPGCGKTIVGSRVIDLLTESDVTCLFFYINFNDPKTLSFDELLRSLIWQLFVEERASRPELEELFAQFGSKTVSPSTDSLLKTFSDMLNACQHVSIIIDAFDELVAQGTPKDTDALIAWIHNLVKAEDGKVQVMVTSREEEKIRIAFQGLTSHGCHITIGEEDLHEDIKAYIAAKFAGPKGLGMWTCKPEIVQETTDKLLAEARGMFRYVACQIQELEHCITWKDLRNTLNNLPKTINDTYARILTGLVDRQRSKIILILRLVLYSKYPVRLKEVADAVLVDPLGEEPLDPQDRLLTPIVLAQYWSSLIKLVDPSQGITDDGEKELHLSHFTVQEFLLKDGRVKQDFEEQVARTSITNVCLSYLQHAVGNIPDSYEPGKPGRFPFLKYSASKWLGHFAATERNDDRVFQRAMDFLVHNTRSYHHTWGAYLRPPREMEGTPLVYAAYARLSIRCLDHLLKNTTVEGVSWTDPRSYSTARRCLGAAVNAGDLESFKFLLASLTAGSVPKEKFLDNFMLWETINTDNEDLMRFLLGSRDWSKECIAWIMDHACRKGSLKYLSMLIEACPSCVNQYEELIPWVDPPLLSTCLGYSNPDTMDDLILSLLKSGAEVHKDFGDGSGVVDCFLDEGWLRHRRPRLLVERPPNAGSHWPSTKIQHLIIAGGLDKSVQWLLLNDPYKAEYDNIDLSIAVLYDHTNIIEMLMASTLYSEMDLKDAKRLVGKQGRLKELQEELDEVILQDDPDKASEEKEARSEWLSNDDQDHDIEDEDVTTQTIGHDNDGSALIPRKRKRSP